MQFLKKESRTGKDMGQFPAGSMKKAVPSFIYRLREYEKAGGGQ